MRQRKKENKDNEYVVDVKVVTIAYGIEFDIDQLELRDVFVRVTDVYEGGPNAYADDATSDGGIPVDIDVLANTR